MSTLNEITSALKEKNLPEFAEKIETIVSQEQSEEEKEWFYKIMIASTIKIRKAFEKDLRILFKKYIPKTSDGYIEVLYPDGTVDKQLTKI